MSCLNINLGGGGYELQWTPNSKTMFPDYVWTEASHRLQCSQPLGLLERLLTKIREKSPSFPIGRKAGAGDTVVGCLCREIPLRKSLAPSATLGFTGFFHCNAEPGTQAINYWHAVTTGTSRPDWTSSRYGSTTKTTSTTSNHDAPRTFHTEMTASRHCPS